jgi:hypothetical protein
MKQQKIWYMYKGPFEDSEILIDDARVAVNKLEDTGIVYREES